MSAVPADLFTPTKEFEEPRARSYRYSVNQLKAKSEPRQAARKGTRLTPRELRQLADRLVSETDPKEVERLKLEMERGFYGDAPDA